MSIKRALASSIATVALAAGAAVMPKAAAASSDGLPDGSWRQSCERAYVQNGMLHALCRRDGGNLQSASAQIGSCRAFGNRNGTLVCESSDGNGGNVGRWSGSFQDSCRDFSVDKQGRLHATCRRDNGTYRDSKIGPQKCRSYRAGNRDGHLVCESDETGSGNAGRWDGSFRNSCRDISAQWNGTLTATCQAANGTWRRTSLTPDRCGSYRAGNRDGNLFCESGDTGGGSSNAGRWDGSFRNSCRDISADYNGTLTATCQAANGSWRRTSLTPGQCGSYRAGNRDGNLFCESGATGSSGNADRWDGSFRRTCRDASMDANGTLTATCQTIGGAWNRSSLSSRQCGSYQAGNRDGTLFCER